MSMNKSMNINVHCVDKIFSVRKRYVEISVPIIETIINNVGVCCFTKLYSFLCKLISGDV